MRKRQTRPIFFLLHVQIILKILCVGDNSHLEQMLHILPKHGFSRVPITQEEKSRCKKKPPEVVFAVFQQPREAAANMWMKVLWSEEAEMHKTNTAHCPDHTPPLPNTVAAASCSGVACFSRGQIWKENLLWSAEYIHALVSPC